MNYNEFAAILFEHKEAPAEPVQTSKPEGQDIPYFEIKDKNRATNVLETLRKKVLARGARGILGLGKLFKIMDDNRSGKLNLEEFTKAIKEYKLGIEEAEIQALFKSFDTDKSGEISYDEFIRTLRVFFNILNMKRVK